jgi:hypothetical protein
MQRNNDNHYAVITFTEVTPKEAMLLSDEIPCCQRIHHRDDDDQHRSFDGSFEVRHGNIHWLHFPSSHSSYLPTSNMASYTTPDQCDSLDSSSRSSDTSSSSSGTSSSPSTGASFLESVIVSRSLSDSASSRNRSMSPRSEIRNHRRSRPFRYDDGYRRRSSWDSAGARHEYSHRVRPSLRGLSQLSWSRLDKSASRLPSDASWVISMHAVQDGKQW